MNAPDILDWIVRGIVGVGGPWTIIKYILRWRQRRAEERSADAHAEVDELTVPDKVKTSSIVTMEAERLALTKSFQDDREIKDRTILFLKEQLADRDRQLASRDERIEALNAQVESLQAKIRHQADELTIIADQLRDLQATPTSGGGAAS